ncbi:unnamed protein product, partial [Polarella glacialis]
DLGANIIKATFGGFQADVLDNTATNNYVVVFAPVSRIRGAVDVVITADNTNEAIKRLGYTYLVACADPGIPDNGYRNGEARREGSTVIYACRFGYTLVGASQATCQFERDPSGNVIVSGGTFLPLRPTCEIVNCPDPGIPRFGTRLGANGTFVFGDVVAFQCPPGYGRFGPAEVSCQGDGKFSGATPTCESDLGSMNLIRYRALFIASFPGVNGAATAFAQADIAPKDDLLSRAEFSEQASSIGVTSSRSADRHLC